MWIGLAVLIIVIALYYCYGMYLKEYVEVKKIFLTLQHVLDTRDVLLLQLSNEKVDEKQMAEIVMLVDERRKTKNSGYTIRMEADVKLHRALKAFYPTVEKVVDNPLSKDLFERILTLEKQAKKIRIAYNTAVERYNQNLILHKKVCMRLIRMKPLDTYAM